MTLWSWPLLWKIGNYTENITNHVVDLSDMIQKGNLPSWRTTLSVHSTNFTGQRVVFQVQYPAVSISILTGIRTTQRWRLFRILQTSDPNSGNMPMILYSYHGNTRQIWKYSFWKIIARFDTLITIYKISLLFPKS